jgi:hypothetical protein
MTTTPRRRHRTPDRVPRTTAHRPETVAPEPAWEKATVTVTTVAILALAVFGAVRLIMLAVS